MIGKATIRPLGLQSTSSGPPSAPTAPDPEADWEGSIRDFRPLTVMYAQKTL